MSQKKSYPQQKKLSFQQLFHLNKLKQYPFNTSAVSKQMIPTIKLSALDKLDKLRNSDKINITTKNKCTLSNLNKPAVKFWLKRNAIKKH